MALLKVENLSVQFGGLKALDHISLSIDEGGFAGLIGIFLEGRSFQTTLHR